MDQKVLKLEYVPRKEQTSDIFTKPLAREPFEDLRDRLGVVYIDATLWYEEKAQFRGRTETKISFQGEIS